MAHSPWRQRIFAIARHIYHALPVSTSTKFKLRRLLVPYMHATVGATEGIGLINALSRMKETRSELEWGGMREIAFQRALTRIGSQAAEYGPVSHVIVLPFLATGGAERVALNFAEAIRGAQPDGTVLLIVADRPVVSDRVELPYGVVPFVLDSVFDASASYEQKQRLLEDLLVAIRPRVLHNINSEVAWGLILRRGDQLRRVTRLFASIFAFQFAPNGRTKTGYAAYFLKPGLPHLVALLSDNERFVRDAGEEYALSAPEKSKLHVVYNPVRVSGESLAPSIEMRLQKLASRPSNRRLRVLWAGRLDEEKRVDLLIELIKQADFADFDVFGQAVVDVGTVLPSGANVTYKGAFGTPEELVQDVVYDAFVFTSRWEGMPNILLEVGMLGVPVIAPTVGGVGELINAETGYPLHERPDVFAYLRALEEIRSRPQDAVERVQALRSLINHRHSWQVFTSTIGQIPEYLNNEQSVTCHKNL